MASYPGAKVHRPLNRRKLGRGQIMPTVPVGVTVIASSADVMQITTDQAVVWQPSIAATVATRTLVGQHVVSPTVVQITFSGAVAGLAYTIPAAAGMGFYGGTTPPVVGTF